MTPTGEKAAGAKNTAEAIEENLVSFTWYPPSRRSAACCSASIRQSSPGPSAL